MTYRVTSPLVLAVDQGGKTHHVYFGGVIDWLSDEQKSFFLAEGLVSEGSGAPPAPATPDNDGKPDHAATKSALIAWLVDNAVRPDGSEYTAGSLHPHNKDELWALIDAVV